MDADISQTLSRGLHAIEILAETPEGLSVNALATRLQLHRSITYRIVRTLEAHHLINRNPSGEVRLGPRLSLLARNIDYSLRQASLSTLDSIAHELGMTAFIATLDGVEVTTLVSVEPSGSHAVVAQRPGTTHSIENGAPGRAISHLIKERQGSSSTSNTGFGNNSEFIAHSSNEVIRGLSSLAVPLNIPEHPPAALAVVYLSGPVDKKGVGARLISGARSIQEALGAKPRTERFRTL